MRFIRTWCFGRNFPFFVFLISPYFENYVNIRVKHASKYNFLELSASDAILI